MSKKIDSARKDLTKALKKHAEIVGGTAVSLKKAQRAAAEIHLAAIKYAALVEAKTGLPSPFGDVLQPGLDTSTMESLTAERDALAKKPKKK
jgi:hypothetical protein